MNVIPLECNKHVWPKALRHTQDVIVEFINQSEPQQLADYAGSELADLWNKGLTINIEYVAAQTPQGLRAGSSVTAVPILTTK
jgi:hypothetical protein